MNELVIAPAPTLEAALFAIAAVCDGADQRDDQGFNGQDAKFGNRMASIAPAEWTPEMHWETHRMLKLYRGQLERAGIDYEAIEAPALPDGFGHNDAKYAARDEARNMARKIGRKADPKLIVHQNGRFEVSFPYDGGMVADLKAIPYRDRQWDGGAKKWLVFEGGAAALRAFAQKYDFEIDAAANKILDGAGEVVIPIAVELAAGGITVTFEYDSGRVARLKDLHLGGRWDGVDRCWRFGLEEADRVVAWAEAEGLSVADEVRAHIAEASTLRAEAVANATAMREASRATEGEMPEVTLPDGLALRPFQAAGIAYALKARRTWIADEMGLGKTVQALVALEAADAFPAVVVVPANVKLNWLREAGRWLPNRKTVTVSGTKPYGVEADLVILNYDVAHCWLPELPAEIKGLILDESHRVKNSAKVREEGSKVRRYKTLRVRACKELSERVLADGLVLLLSGTPVVNRPNELVAQLDILGQLHAFGGASKFLSRFCAGHIDNHGHWTTSGASHLQELNDRLRAACYVRRRKSEVLTELPPKVWADVTMDELDAKVLAEYREAEANVIDYLAERAEELAKEAGEDGKAAGWEARLRAEAAEHLVRINALRRLAARAKMPAIHAWVSEFTESDSKLVIFAHHREVVDELAQRYGADKIQGGIGDQERQDAVDRFQNDPDAKLIVCSIQAGSEGITLTAASDVLFAEQPWTPAALDQAADRCHRIGQQDSVTAWVSLATETIDMDMAELLAGKRKVVNAATDGGKVGAQTSIAADLMVRLAKRGMKRNEAQEIGS